MDNKTKKLREELADYAHQAWSHWMKYLFKKSSESEDGVVIIPDDLVLRWKRQIETQYNDLTEKEKESDRKEADKMLSIISRIEL